MSGFAPRIPAPVQRDVSGDPEQPGAELGFRLISVAKTVDAQEDILRQLLRDGPVTHQAIQVIDHLAAVPREQGLKTGLVPTHTCIIKAASGSRAHSDTMQFRTLETGAPFPPML